MKKLFICLFVILMLIILCPGCSTTASTKEDEAWNTFFIDFSQKTDSSSDTYSYWSSAYFVDEFGSPTDKAYVRLKKYTQQGYFSNSATNKSDAYIDFIVEKEAVCFELFEYRKSSPVTLLSFEGAYLKVQTENGEVLDLGCCSKYSEKRVAVEEEAARTLLEAMVDNSTLKFRIEIKSKYGSPSVYQFTIPTAGFLAVYQKTFLQDINASTTEI